MADTYDDTNRGALFRNDNKKSEKHPDHTGSLKVKCPCCGEVSPFWLSAWIRVSKAGSKYFSLSVSPKEASNLKPAGNKSMGETIDDDIPF